MSATSTSPTAEPPPRASPVSPPTQALVVLAVGLLVPNPDNPRDLSDPSPAEVKELLSLGESMRDEGQKQPLRVFPLGDGTYRIVSGHRRFYAARLVGIERLTCLVLAATPTAAELLVDQLIENGQRRDLDDLAKLETFQKLLRLNGWSPKQLADALKVSEGQVSRVLTLKRLCPEVQELVRTGQLKGTLAYHIARVGSPDRQMEFARQVLAGMTREVLEVKVREALKGGPKRCPRPPVIAIPYTGLDATERALLAEVEDIRAARRKGYTDADYATKLRNRKGGK